MLVGIPAQVGRGKLVSSLAVLPRKSLIFPGSCCKNTLCDRARTRSETEIDPRHRAQRGRRIFPLSPESSYCEAVCIRERRTEENGQQKRRIEDISPTVTAGNYCSTCSIGHPVKSIFSAESKIPRVLAQLEDFPWKLARMVLACLDTASPSTPTR